MIELPIGVTKASKGKDEVNEKKNREQITRTRNYAEFKRILLYM